MAIILMCVTLKCFNKPGTTNFVIRWHLLAIYNNNYKDNEM